MTAIEARGVLIPPVLPGIERIRLLLGADPDAPLRLWIWPEIAVGPDDSVVVMGNWDADDHPITISSPSYAVILSIDDDVLRDPDRTEAELWAEVVRAVDAVLDFQGVA